MQRGKGQKGFSMGSVLQDGELDTDLQHFCEQGRLHGDDAVASCQHLWHGFLLKGSLCKQSDAWNSEMADMVHLRFKMPFYPFLQTI